MESDPAILKVGEGWIVLEVTAEPTVRPTFRGYAPVLPIRVIKTGLDYHLFISAKSIAEGLEPLRKARGGTFAGLCFSVRKAGADKMSPYEIKVE